MKIPLTYILKAFLIYKKEFSDIMGFIIKQLIKYYIPIKRKILNKYDLILLSGKNPLLFLLHPLFQSFKDKTISLTDDSFYVEQILDKGLGEGKESSYAKLLYDLEKKIFSQFNLTFCSNSYISFVKKIFNISNHNKLIRKPFGSSFEIFNLNHNSEIKEISPKRSNPQNSEIEILKKKVKFLKKKGYNIVIMFAKFQRMHGVDIVINAFRILNRSNKKIKLLLIGKPNKTNPKSYNIILHNYLKTARKLNNIVFYPRNIPLYDLYKLISYADLGLGIFGESFRSNITIPLKIFDMSYCGLPFITLNSKAIKEYFPQEISRFFCSGRKSKELATKILEYFELSKETRKRLGSLLKKIYKEKFSYKNQVKLILDNFI